MRAVLRDAGYLRIDICLKVARRTLFHVTRAVLRDTGYLRIDICLMAAQRTLFYAQSSATPSASCLPERSPSKSKTTDKQSNGLAHSRMLIMVYTLTRVEQ